MSYTARTPTAAEVQEIFAILVSEAGVHVDTFAMFEHAWPECREYRFMGKLGAGGKVWFNPSSQHAPVYVTCYPEDENAERHELIERLNEKLSVFAQ